MSPHTTGKKLRFIERRSTFPCRSGAAPGGRRGTGGNLDHALGLVSHLLGFGG